jgi:hypothetical protein
MKKKILPTLAVLAIAAVTYASPNQDHAMRIGAFTLKKNIFLYRKDGTVETRREIYRRASDGSFRIIETDGRRIFFDRGFSQGRGFYHVDYERKTLWRDTTQKPHRDPDLADPAVFMRDAFYVGTDTLLGRTAYHLRLPGMSEGSVDSDDWYFAETDHVPVKTIFYRADGSIESTAEVYSLEFGEPDPAYVRLPQFQEADQAADKH